MTRLLLLTLIGFGLSGCKSTGSVSGTGANEATVEVSDKTEIALSHKTSPQVKTQKLDDISLEQVALEKEELFHYKVGLLIEEIINRDRTALSWRIKVDDIAMHFSNELDADVVSGHYQHRVQEVIRNILLKGLLSSQFSEFDYRESLPVARDPRLTSLVFDYETGDLYGTLELLVDKELNLYDVYFASNGMSTLDNLVQAARIDSGEFGLSEKQSSDLITFFKTAIDPQTLLLSYGLLSDELKRIPMVTNLVLSSLNRVQNAESLGARLLKQMASAKVHHPGLVDFYVEHQAYGDALASLDSLPESAKVHWNIQGNYSVIHALKNDKKTALHYAYETVKHNPNSEMAYWFAAKACIEMKEFELALKSLLVLDKAFGVPVDQELLDTFESPAFSIFYHKST